MSLLSSRSSPFTPLLVKLAIDPGNPLRSARILSRCAMLRRPRLLIDCASLPCLRTHGVAHLTSYLLLLHQTGAKVLLHNVSPALYRVLHLLRLDTVFRVYPPASSQKVAVTNWSTAA